MHKQLLSASTAVLLTSGVLAGKPSLPRGVAPEDAKLYVPSASKTFTCLTNPSITIPFASVNDDYCDCPDGSDEPGTSACSHVSYGKLGIRGFYCANQPGHVGGYIPLSRVNDGVCDYELCCDGSDEWAGVGGVKCENRCSEVGEKVRKLLGERGRIRNEGAEKRRELERRAAEIRKGLEDEVKALEGIIKSLEFQVEELNAEVKTIEARERAKAVKAGKTKVKGKERVNVVKEVVEGKIQELKTALERVREEEKGARESLVEAEVILKGLKDTYNPNFNDEGVKAAVRKWDDYVAAGKSVGLGKRSDAEERDLDELISGEGIDWDDLMPEEGEGEVPEIYKIEQYLPEGIRKWVHQKLDEARQFMVDNGLLAEYIPPDTHEPKAVTDAKARVATVQTDLTAKRNSLKNAQSELSIDYGPAEVFRPLKGTCISNPFGEYTYEFCFFEKSYQRSLKDSSSSFLGDHKRIEIVDTNMSDKQKGIVFETDDVEELHEEKLAGVVLHYDGGARCWNGPPRSAKVELYCATENEIRSVLETEKCVYTYEVGTPAVCKGEEGAEEAMKSQVRDEL
ncbi:glucosidase II beta subunit-like-domain-containing protein [Kalaharituber pfeilii]|nr:glucosidase II beta subunit-like-domain-containing protein [Kalaharituber pfeilii]